MKTLIKVKNLKAGDLLSQGAEVMSNPVSLTNTRKGYCELVIKYANGNVRNNTWNRNTTLILR